MGSVVLPVAGLAEDLAIGRVTTGHTVQRALALKTREARLVEHVVLGQHLLGMEHLAIAPWTSLLVI